MTNDLINQTKYLMGIHCPACFETQNQKILKFAAVHNSHSRFCDAYICSACGIEESFKGFFWRDKALSRGFELYRNK
jgi:hypothetical protein